VPLAEGLRRTIEFYRTHFSRYVEGCEQPGHV
jgi:hypothetical protein